MSKSSDKMRAFIESVLSYAQKTGISRRMVGPCLAWKRLGLPDMRGFAPHLRTVCVPSDQPQRWTHDALWLIHDLLHIVFYDFASLHLAEGAFATRDRFIETHLASEAYAVLALDYHQLSDHKQGGLATDINQGLSREIIRQLGTDARSNAFVTQLCALYFENRGLLRRAPPQKASAAFKNWLGHEQRYAAKQRDYVSLWWSDLQQILHNSSSASSVRLVGTHVDEALIELLQNPAATRRHHPRRATNYFRMLPKYRAAVATTPAESIDFRFQSYASLKPSAVRLFLARAHDPSASILFLMWQLLSSAHPSEFSKAERQTIKDLARQSQSSYIDSAHWNRGRELASSRLSHIGRWAPDQRLRSVFYLP